MRRKLDRFLVLGGVVAVASAALLGAPDAAVRLVEVGCSKVATAVAPADDSGPADTLPPEPLSSPVLTAMPPPPPPLAPVALAVPRLEEAAPVVALGLDANRYPEVHDGPEKVA